MKFIISICIFLSLFQHLAIAADLPPNKNSKTNYERLEKHVGVTDFSAYYCAYQAYKNRQNPYDSKVLSSYCSKIKEATSTFKLSYMYPPWLLPLLFPVLKLDFKYSAALWYTLNCIFILASGVFIWKALAPNKKIDPLLCGIASLVFPPALECLEWGQISLFISLAFSIYLWAYSRKKDYLAGIAITILFLKFHLFLIFLPVTFIQVLREKRYRIIISSFLSLLTLAIICELQVPIIHSFWIESIANTSLHGTHSKTSSISGILSQLINNDNIFKLTPVIGFLFLALLYLRKKAISSVELITISLAFAPYAWFHDFCSLQALQVISVAKSESENLQQTIKSRLMPFILLQLVTVVCSLLIFNSQHQLFWYPFLLLITYRNLLPSNKINP